MDRLQQRWPDAYVSLASCPVTEQRRLAVRATDEALAANGLARQRLDDAGVLAAEVQRADEAAWDVQERADRGEARVEDYYAAFRRARALNAALLAHHGGSPTEAVYEALHALPDGTRPRDLLGG